MVVARADAVTLTRLLQTNKSLRELSFYVINQKVTQLIALEATDALVNDTTASHSALSGLSMIASDQSDPSISRVRSITDQETLQIAQQRHNSLLVSLFSPQNVENKIELYETKCVSNQSSTTSSGTHSVSMYSSSSSASSTDSLVEKDSSIVTDNNLQTLDTMLTELDQHQEDTYSTAKVSTLTLDPLYSCFALGSLLKLRDPFTKKTSPFNQNSSGILPMHLIVDEDSNAVKVSIQLSLPSSDPNTASTTVLDHSERIHINHATTEPQCLLSLKKAFALTFKLEQGEELPPRGPYDYEIMTNYYLQVDSITLNNCYFLKCVEEATVAV